MTKVSDVVAPYYVQQIANEKTRPVVPLLEVIELNPRKFSNPPTEDEPVSFVPMKAVEEESGHLDPSEVRPWSEVRKGYTPFEEDDVIFAKITPCMENGKYALAQGLIGGRAAGSTEFHVLRPRPSLDSKYLLYYLLRTELRQSARQNMRGAAGQLRVPPIFFEGLSIPLPSLDEQRRIVAEIEEQLSRLEAGVAALKRVRTNLKRYRTAVLEEACSLALSDPIQQGRKTTLGDWLSSIEAGKSFRCEERPPTDDEVGVTKVSAVTWGFYDENESKTCCDAARVDARFFVKLGDFLFSRANTIDLVGACVIAGAISRKIMLSDKILRFSFIAGIRPKWALYWLRSKNGRKEIERLATGNQESMRNIGQERIRQIEIAVPSESVQDRLIDVIDRRLSVVEEVDTQVRADLSRAERLKQSILQQAFSATPSTLSSN